MITTNSFPNTITSSEIKELKYNTLSKESLEGKAKKNYLDFILKISHKKLTNYS